MVGRFSRLAIVNRGEPAMRLIHAVRELNQQRDEDIRLIALYTEPERDAMFVRNADEAICIGPSMISDADGGRRNGYLDQAALEVALRRTRADAAWVGWGFVAERPEFAELCERMGIVFIGPDAPVMRLLGDKIERQAARRGLGCPGGGVERRAGPQRRGCASPRGTDRLPADDQGGGRWWRARDSPGRDAAQIPAAFASARAEAAQAFGDGTLLLERLISGARHVEVQIVADGLGNAWSLGVRRLLLSAAQSEGGGGVGEPSAEPGAGA